jgi:hypothetical protein
MHVFNNVLMMDLEHIRCPTTEENSVEHDMMCHKGSIM